MKSTRSWLHALVLALALASTAQAGPSGAIFTTDADSSFVNGNVYDSKEQVYLNGGPRPNAPCTAAGLPDGDYVFQVTDPAGSVLLSVDDASNRIVHIMGGVIVEYLGTHPKGTGKCPGSITVGLGLILGMPDMVGFNDTPNPGGEYKVWMTRVEDLDPYGRFVHSKSKTDNFKVVPPEGPGD